MQKMSHTWDFAKAFITQKSDDKYTYNGMHAVAITRSVSKQEDV